MSIIVGIAYSANQYRDSKQKDQTNLELQLTNARFEAQKPFYLRQLELCEQASSAAAILATPKVQVASDLQKAKGNFLISQRRKRARMRISKLTLSEVFKF